MGNRKIGQRVLTVRAGNRFSLEERTMAVLSVGGGTRCRRGRWLCVSPMRDAEGGIGESDGCRRGDGDLVGCIDELMEHVFHVSQALLKGVELVGLDGFESGEVGSEVLEKICGY